VLNWLHQLPTLFGVLAVCAAFLLPTLVGSYFLQPAVARLFSGEKDVNTVLGFLLNAFALYFGVLLALLSIAVFENHNRAEETVDREAGGIVTLHRNLFAYPQPLQKELRKLLLAYVDEEIGPGWDAQRRGEVSRREIALLDQFHRRLTTFAPTTNAETVIQAATLRSFDDFVEHRRLRIAAAPARIPLIMWYIVLSGAVINIIVIWMFDLRWSTHAIIAGVLSLFIALVIYMIAVLDKPFMGRDGLMPDALIAVREQIAATDKPDG
jgi:hypothetical protein